MAEQKKSASKSTRRTASKGSTAGAAKKKPSAKKGTSLGAKPAAKRAGAGTKPAKTRRVSLPPPPADATTRRREAAKKLAIQVAVTALDKKAERVEIVDIGEKVDYADYLVVMTGRSDRQVLAIAQALQEQVEKTGGKTHGREGMPQGHWVLIDFGDVIVHVFLDEARKYYDLEGLWMDAPRVPTPSFVPPGPAPSNTEG